MTLIYRFAAVVSTLVLASSALPAPAATPSQTSDKLQPMAFLAGHCWKGTFPGRAVTDEHCFEWMYNGNYLRDRHVVRGDSVPYGGETTYAWDAQQKKIVYWYIAMPGFFSRGTVDPRPGALVFDDTIITTAGAQSIRSTWRTTGADTYSIRVEQLTSAGSKELWTMEMRRQ